jgi:hypothetical protein
MPSIRCVLLAATLKCPTTLSDLTNCFFGLLYRNNLTLFYADPVLIYSKSNMGRCDE